MLWKTHIRIANEILSKLRMPKWSLEADRLRKGSVVPDKWQDYPHHHGRSGKIREFILQARKCFLNDDMADACYNLGVALHYVQDSYTSLSTRSRHHSGWEQQIEQAHFVEDLEELVRSAFRDRRDRREDYVERIRLLSEEVEGKENTLRVATLPGPGLSFWGDRIWGRPNVDLNFAFRASLVIAKSIFGSKTNPDLQVELHSVLAEHEAKLRETEIIFANQIVELIKRRDELKKRRKKDGVFQILRSCFLTISSKIHGARAALKVKEYEQRKHLEKVAKAYQQAAKKLVAPHSGWFNIIIPKIDINTVHIELLSLQEASEHFGISESITKDLIKRGKISYYSVRDRELVKRSDLKKIL